MDRFLSSYGLQYFIQDVKLGCLHDFNVMYLFTMFRDLGLLVCDGLGHSRQCVGDIQFLSLAGLLFIL